MEEVIISYDSHDNTGVFKTINSDLSAVWPRLASSALNFSSSATSVNNQIRLPWYQILFLLREFIPLQRQLIFAFKTDETSKDIVLNFIHEQKATKDAASGRTLLISEEALTARLQALGFTKSNLRDFQTRDAAR
jgi:hypothetical protein